MPVADARVRLPRLGLYGVRRAALDVADKAFLLVFGKHFAKQHCLQLAVMLFDVEVVKIGGNLQTGITDRPQRQGIVVEINQIRLVLMDEVNRAVVKFIAVSLVGYAGAITPVPLAVNGVGIAKMQTGRVILRIEILRIEAVPPFARSIGLR